jgi:uncharacterized protein YunC (DUF1805 family)
MTQEKVKVQLSRKQADGYIIPLGPVNLVSVITDVGMVGCGAFDVMALDKFQVPAARVKGVAGPVATIEDLMKAIVKDANEAASKIGVKTGMTGKEALELM